MAAYGIPAVIYAGIVAKILSHERRPSSAGRRAACDGHCGAGLQGRAATHTNDGYRPCHPLTARDGAAIADCRSFEDINMSPETNSALISIEKRLNAIEEFLVRDNSHLTSAKDMFTYESLRSNIKETILDTMRISTEITIRDRDN
jgi:hypothetical protein